MEDVPAFVADRIAERADYIKFLIDDGAALGHPSPTMSPALTAAIVDEAHRNGKMAVTHVTTTQQVSAFRDR